MAVEMNNQLSLELRFYIDANTGLKIMSLQLDVYGLELKPNKCPCKWTILVLSSTNLGFPFSLKNIYVSDCNC